MNGTENHGQGLVLMNTKDCFKGLAQTEKEHKESKAQKRATRY